VGGFPGIGGEADAAVDMFGEVLGERGLAGAGVTEQAEDRRAAGMQPAGGSAQRTILLRAKSHRGTTRERPENSRIARALT